MAEVAEVGANVPIEHEVDGHTILFEAARSDDPRGVAFEGAHPSQRWCVGPSQPGCSECTAERAGPAGPAMLARLPDGEIIAVARITPRPEAPGRGRLALCASGRYATTWLVRNLVALLAETAREEGYQGLSACVPYSTHDVLVDCSEGGFEVESALTVGGMTEVFFKVR